MAEKVRSGQDSNKLLRAPKANTITTELKRILPYALIDLIILVYLSSLLVAHLSDAPRQWLVVTGDSARIQDETSESSAWFYNVLGVWHRHTGPRFKVSSERQLITVRLTSPGIEPTTSSFHVEHFNHRAMQAGNLPYAFVRYCIKIAKQPCLKELVSCNKGNLQMVKSMPMFIQRVPPAIFVCAFMKAPFTSPATINRSLMASIYTIERKLTQD